MKSFKELLFETKIEEKTNQVEQLEEEKIEEGEEELNEDINKDVTVKGNKLVVKGLYGYPFKKPIQIDLAKENEEFKDNPINSVSIEKAEGDIYGFKMSGILYPKNKKAPFHYADFTLKFSDGRVEDFSIDYITYK